MCGFTTFHSFSSHYSHFQHSSALRSTTSESIKLPLNLLWLFLATSIPSQAFCSNFPRFFFWHGKTQIGYFATLSYYNKANDDNFLKVISIVQFRCRDNFTKQSKAFDKSLWLCDLENLITEMYLSWKQERINGENNAFKQLMAAEIHLKWVSCYKNNVQSIMECS